MSRSDRSDRLDNSKKYQTIGKWLDAKCDSCSGVTDEPADGYSYAYSSYMADMDMDVVILAGSNRSNAFYLTSQILGYLDLCDTAFSIPYASRDRRFVTLSGVQNQRPALYREFGFGISEQSLYYFIYTCSTKYVKQYAPYADEYTPYAQRQLRLSYADVWSDIADRGSVDYLDDSGNTYLTEDIDDAIHICRSEFTDTVCRNFDNMLNHLISEMSRLLDYAREVWSEIIVPFINSSDCSWNVMRYVSDRDDWVFIEFVKSSSTYRVMKDLVSVLENHKKNVLDHNYV